MREFEEVEKTTIKRKLTRITCNKCGESSSEVEDARLSEFQEIVVSFGYGSRYDMESWSFDLCEDCLTEIVRMFKHVPEGFGESSYYARYPQIMFEHWKETGEVNLEAGMTEEDIEARGGSIYVNHEED